MAVSDSAADVNPGVIDTTRKLWIVAVLVGSLLAVFLPPLLTNIFFVRDGRSTNDILVFVILPTIQAILLVGLPFVLVRKMRHLSAFDCVWLRWDRSEFIKFWLMPLGVVLSLAITAFLMHQLGLPITEDVSCEHDYTLILGWCTVFNVLVNPFAEEVFWRGYVQSTLTRLVHPAIAIIGQAALFGLIHFRPGLGFMEASLFGLILGLWCYRRKTLLPAIVVHMAINGVAYAEKWASWSELHQIRVTHDYVADFLESSKPALYDPSDDARAEYARAYRLVTDLPVELDSVWQKYPAQWSPNERARAEAWVASNGKALDDLEDGSRRTTYWPEYEFPGGMLPPFTPGHKKIRLLVFAVSMRAKLSAVDGRHEDAFADILTCYRLAAHLGQCHDVVANLLAMAARGAASETARLILAQEEVDGTLLVFLQRQLEGFRDSNEFAVDFASERLWGLDIVQRLFTDDGHGGGHMPRCAFRPGGLFASVFGDLAEATGSDINKLRELDRRTTTEALHRYCRAFEKLTALAPWDYEKNVEGVRETVEKIASENLLIQMFSPTMKIGHTTARARVELDSVITILAILRYKADRQQLPKGFGELLAEGYLRSVPRDPYGSDALMYRRLNSDFVLYSRGADFDDDEGTPSKWGEGADGGDHVFWPAWAGD